MIYRIMGFLLLIETAMLMCCGGVSLFYKEDDLNSFLGSHIVTQTECVSYFMRGDKLDQSSH